jgi:acetyltransferase
MKSVMPTLKKLFYPDSIAIIGASRDPKKIGAIVLANLIGSGFKGKLFPVNPKAEVISNIQSYATIASLPEVPDMAVVAIPSQFVVDSLRGLGKKGTKHVVILSAGFKEIGAEGEQLEKDLLAVAKEYDLAILGPNCLGFINNNHHINASFGKVSSKLGNLRFMSQSGAIASSVFDWADYAGIGFSEFITLGNKSILSENDLLDYWAQETTASANEPGLSPYQPIGMYLESIDEGSNFFAKASQLAKTQPLFILKPGKSHAAQQAMQSHTGSIAGEDAVMDQAFKQAGIIRCHGVEDLFDLSRAFAWEQAPNGPKVAIVSNAGGPAVISTDFIEEAHLQLADLDAHTKELLETQLPRAASIVNPVDVLGDALADRYMAALDAVLAQASVDAAVVILTPQITTQVEQTAEVIKTMSQKYQKPIMCSFMGGSAIVTGEQILDRAKIPSFRYPERAIQVLGKMWWWQHWRSQSKPSSAIQETTSQNIDFATTMIRNVRQDGRTVLTGHEANELLAQAGIAVPPQEIVANQEQALAFAAHQEWPVVLKITSSKALHKQDIGGVITNIHSQDQLHQAWEQLQQSLNTLGDDQAHIQIQKQVEAGVEVIVGIKRDPSFGNIMMFGAGGTLAELVADRNLLVLTQESSQIAALVRQAKIAKVLEGYRGEAPFAVQKLQELMIALANLAQSVDEFAEIEINPVIVTHSQAWAVDGKAILR